jgi:hypothetical protein
MVKFGNFSSRSTANICFQQHPEHKSLLLGSISEGKNRTNVKLTSGLHSALKSESLFYTELFVFVVAVGGAIVVIVVVVIVAVAAIVAAVFIAYPLIYLHHLHEIRPPSPWTATLTWWEGLCLFDLKKADQRQSEMK